MEIIEKPWGKEEILEANTHYVVKRLFMKAGSRCSLQYHRQKRETIYVLSGVLLIHFGTTITNLVHGTTLTMHPGDARTILPHTIHRMEGKEDTVYLECSTTELDDVVRIEDDYGRE